MTKDLQGKTFQSVLKDWVCDLGLREQGTLLTAIRGCDLTPKMPLISTERNLTAFIRYAVMNPFDEREIDSEPGCFMQSRIDFSIFRASQFGHYPQHYVSHLIHALEIIGYRCPHEIISADALKAYNSFCKSLHLNPETIEQMTERLNEDRIEKNCIVE